MSERKILTAKRRDAEALWREAVSVCDQATAGHSPVLTRRLAEVLARLARSHVDVIGELQARAEMRSKPLAPSP